jgi:ATP-dependent RNA helicase RhlE
VTPTSFDGLGLSEPLRLALKTENYLKPTPDSGAGRFPFSPKAGTCLVSPRPAPARPQPSPCQFCTALSTQRLQRSPGRPHALILAPTRELALQTDERFRAYGRGLGLRSAVIFGGVGQGQQVKALQQGVDILIATPGRLLDLYGQRHVSFDRFRSSSSTRLTACWTWASFAMCERSSAACGRERQTLLFSATMPPDIAKLAAEILRNPVASMCRRLRSPSIASISRFISLPAQAKRDLLLELLADPAMDRVLVFTRTKAWCRQGLQVSAAGRLGGGSHPRQQGAKCPGTGASRRSAAGRPAILVATDIAARGIDVAWISHVINYELPNEPESYVHRIGRTARAGAGGTALSFCDRERAAYLKDIERLTRVSLAVAGHRHTEAEGTETVSKGWRPERSRASAGAEAPRAFVSAPAPTARGDRHGRRGNALPAARGALTRPRSARVSLSGEPR